MSTPAYSPDMARLCAEIMPEGEATTDVVDQVCARVPHGGRILEIGSGYGRLLVELADRGYRCVGVEQSPHLHELARRNASRRGVSVDLRCLDAREICAESEYDAVLVAGATFTLFSHEDQPRLLRTCAAALRFGGALFVDLHDADVIRRAHALGPFDTTYPGTRRGEVNASSTLTRDVWETVYHGDEGDTASPSVVGTERHFLIDAPHLVQLAARAGLSCERSADRWGVSAGVSAAPSSMRVCQFVRASNRASRAQSALANSGTVPTSEDFDVTSD